MACGITSHLNCLADVLIKGIGGHFAPHLICGGSYFTCIVYFDCLAAQVIHYGSGVLVKDGMKLVRNALWECAAEPNV